MSILKQNWGKQLNLIQKYEHFEAKLGETIESDTNMSILKQNWGKFIFKQKDVGEFLLQFVLEFAEKNF